MTAVKAITARQSADLLPRLEGLLGLADVEELRCDLLHGAAGERCVVPTAGADRLIAPDAPPLWAEVDVDGERVAAGEVEFAVQRRQAGVGALELMAATALTDRAPTERWRYQVLFSFADAQSAGRVVLQLLRRGVLQMSYLHADGVEVERPFALLVREPPLYTILAAITEGQALVHYQAPDPRDDQRHLELFLPWGWTLPLLDAARPRLDGHHLVRCDATVTRLPVGDFEEIHVALEPRPLGAVEAVQRLDPDALRIEVPLRLERTAWHGAQDADIWLLETTPAAHLARLFYCAEARLQGLMAQAVRVDGQRLLAVWDTEGRAGPDPLQLAGRDGVRAFTRCRAAALRTLMLLVGRQLTPRLLDATLSRTFELSEGELTLLDRDVEREGAMRVLRLPTDGFVALRDALVDYTLEIHHAALEPLVHKARFAFASLAPRAKARALDGEAGVTVTPPLVTAADDSDVGADTGRDPRPAAPTAPAPPPRPPEPVAPLDQAGSEERGPGMTTLAERAAELLEHLDDRVCWERFKSTAFMDKQWQDADAAAIHLAFNYPGDVDAHLDYMEISAGSPYEAPRRLAAWLTGSRTDRSRTTLARHVLGIYLYAALDLGALKPEERLAVTRLGRLLDEVTDPMLGWLYARAAHRLLGDELAVETARLRIERDLLDLPHEACVPPAVAQRLEERSVTTIAEAARAFRQRFAPEWDEALWTLWFRLLSLLDLRRRGLRTVLLDATTARHLSAAHGLDGAFQGAGPLTRQNHELALGLFAAWRHAESCGRQHPAACAGVEHFSRRNGPLRTLLMATGLLDRPHRGGPPSTHGAPPTAAELRHQLEALWGQDEERVQRTYVELLGRVGESLQFDQLLAVLESVDTLWRLEYTGTLDRLHDFLSTQHARIKSEPDARTAQLVLDLGLVTLEICLGGSSAAGEGIRRVAEQLGQEEGIITQPRSTARLLAALVHLPARAVRPVVDLVFSSLRDHRALPALAPGQTVILHEVEVLAWIINLMIHTTPPAEEAQRLRRATLARIRAVVTRESQQLQRGEPLPCR